MTDEIKRCPFCGSNNIGYSKKNRGKLSKYIAMYCKDCNCYGKRQIVRWDEDNSNLKQIAIRNWNQRFLCVTENIDDISFIA